MGGSGLQWMTDLNTMKRDFRNFGHDNEVSCWTECKGRLLLMIHSVYHTI
jgi:hypothetical protein